MSRSTQQASSQDRSEYFIINCYVRMAFTYREPSEMIKNGIYYLVSSTVDDEDIPISHQLIKYLSKLTIVNTAMTKN